MNESSGSPSNIVNKFDELRDGKMYASLFLSFRLVRVTSESEQVLYSLTVNSLSHYRKRSAVITLTGIIFLVKCIAFVDCSMHRTRALRCEIRRNHTKLATNGSRVTVDRYRIECQRDSVSVHALETRVTYYKINSVVPLRFLVTTRTKRGYSNDSCFYDRKSTIPSLENYEHRV